MIGNPGDGASPSCSIVDKYHEHIAGDLYETMQAGMGARDYYNMTKFAADSCIDCSLTLERFAGWACVLGPDLASKSDLAVMVKTVA